MQPVGLRVTGNEIKFEKKRDGYSAIFKQTQDFYKFEARLKILKTEQKLS